MAFVILTSKPGHFRTEPTEGIAPVESWDYMFCGRKRAAFTIAELLAPGRVRIIDESGPVNLVPTKFLEAFDSIEEARAELQTLTAYRSMPAELRRATA